MRRNPLPALALLCTAFLPTALDATPRPPGGGAVTGIRLVLDGGRVVEDGAIVWRDGRIVAAGEAKSVAIPADVVARDGKGWTAYPGLIEIRDLREPAKVEGAAAPRNLDPGPDPLPLAADAARNRKLREAGFVASLISNKKGVLRGEGLLASLGDEPADERVLARSKTQNVALVPVDDGYPSSIMGAVAGVRQAFSDALWLPRAEAAFALDPSQARPRWSAASAGLGRAARGGETVVFEAGSAVASLRAASLARELKVPAWIAGSGTEFRRLEELRASGLPQIVPLEFPEKPKKGEEGDRGPELDELRAWALAPENPAKLAASGLPVAFSSFRNDEPGEIFAALAQAKKHGLTEAQAIAGLSATPARLLGVDDRWGAIAPGRGASFVLVDGELFVDKPKIREVWIEGRRYELAAKDEKGEKKDKAGDAPKKEETVAGAPVAMEPGVDPTAAWRSPIPARPAAVLVRDATIWTSGPAGRLEHADLLVRDGKVAAVGAKLEAPAGATVIDAAGRHVTSGLIDCHSHTGVEGSVNEGTNIVTAEVRIADVLDSEDVNLYRELAGGLTVANVLHGSANAIGGQNAVIKLRWGAPPSGLLFAAAPPGVKFALGENPKQSNWGVKPAERRFPQTRMGVEQAIRQEFLAARDYRAEWDAWERLPDKERSRHVPPRRDFQLDAISEILAGKRLVHSHAYRADEMLMLMNVAESFGFRVATFQHVLEGYKIADEIARHGAGASGFSDWWAYKYEVIDAIPWNGAILHDRGVVASFNSDSDELARHLNVEAAKAVRYGGLSEEEALKFVTLNPAKQLRVDGVVGSLEPGKDADFVIWSGSPLSTMSRVDETWIDGRKYFDRSADLEARERLERERAARLAALEPESGKKDEAKDEPEKLESVASVATKGAR